MMAEEYFFVSDLHVGGDEQLKILDLACYPGFVDRLAEYGVALEQKVVITRELAGKKIWIEHGMQRDPSNYMPDFGNPQLTTRGSTKPPPVSSRCCNIWSPSSQGATRSKTYRKEQSSGRPPG
jgi:hypothetical protein